MLLFVEIGTSLFDDEDPDSNYDLTNVNGHDFGDIYVSASC